METVLVIIATALVVGIPILVGCAIALVICSILDHKELKSISKFLSDPPPFEFRSFGHPGKCDHEEEPKKENGQYL